MPYRKALKYVILYLDMAIFPCHGWQASASDDLSRLTQHVYLIIARDCTTHPAAAYLTGFRLGDPQELITALHGVVNCDHLSAQSDNGDTFDVDLERVNIPMDVAILKPRERLPAFHGLNLQQELPSESPTLLIVGYPLGQIYPLISHVVARPTHNELGCPTGKVPVRTFFGDAKRKGALYKRKSPDPDLCVLPLEGHVRAGESGAPVFKPNQEVVGIAIGSVLQGPPAIAWATPLDSTFSTQPQSEVKEKLAKLKTLNPDDVSLSDVRTSDVEIAGFGGVGTGTGTPSAAGGISLSYALGRRRIVLPYLEFSGFSGINQEHTNVVPSTQQILSRKTFRLSFKETHAGIQLAASRDHKGAAPFVSVGAGEIWTQLSNVIVQDLSPNGSQVQTGNESRGDLFVHIGTGLRYYFRANFGVRVDLGFYVPLDSSNPELPHPLVRAAVGVFFQPSRISLRRL